MDVHCDFFTNSTAWPPFKYASEGTQFVIGTLLSFVGFTGILGNGLVLIVFSRFRRLRGPFSWLILNLAVADLGSSILHIMVVVSSFKGKWYFGHTGCVIYAFGVGLFGLQSIFTMAAISVERYMVITATPIPTWKMTSYWAKTACLLSWMYCLCLTLPPVFGWSRYVVDGLLTSCSWDYTTRTLENTLFYLYLLGFGFLVPVSVIAYCYIYIMKAVLAHGKEMATVSMTPGNQSTNPKSDRAVKCSRRSALKTAEIVLMLIGMFLFSWTPYAIVTFIGQFGPVEWYSPWVAAVPAFFAKTSVIYNPIVYGLSHPHFRSSLRQYMSTWGASVTSVTENHPETGCCMSTVQTEAVNHHLHFRRKMTIECNSAPAIYTHQKRHQRFRAPSEGDLCNVIYHSSARVIKHQITECSV